MYLDHENTKVKVEYTNSVLDIGSRKNIEARKHRHSTDSIHHD